MRLKALKTVIAFYTTTDAMKTEAVMKKAGIEGRLIPVPRQMSASCGIAWSMKTEDYKGLSENIKEQLPEFEKVREILL